MATNLDVIKCVIFTLRRENVIVPHALVAEIISVKDVDDVKNVPNWMLGEMSWRGSKVPLVSFEAAGGAEVAQVNLNTQAVILFAVGDNDKVKADPYIALIMTGVPHVSEFRRDQMLIDEEALVDHPMVAQKVRINGASASVLNVDAMVDMLSRVGVTKNK